jgi:glycosyltransferase involved in cell wall biosynthesis
MTDDRSAAKPGCAPSVCLVVPCYNEAARLDTESFRDFIAANACVRVLFVDDGSRDNTLEVLARLQRGLEERSTVLPTKPNRGKAEAVRLGILHALDRFQPDVVGFWDADLATPLQAIHRFLEIFDSRREIEMVFGSRVKLLGRDVRRRALRHYLGRIFATAVSTILRLPIYDTQCGAKLFRVEPHTRQVFAEPFLSKWVFDVEIIARYLRLYNRDTKRMETVIYEYPLETWIDIAGSKVRPTDFLIAFWDVMRIRRKYLS